MLFIMTGLNLCSETELYWTLFMHCGIFSDFLKGVGLSTAVPSIKGGSCSIVLFAFFRTDWHVKLAVIVWAAGQTQIIIIPHTLFCSVTGWLMMLARMKWRKTWPMSAASLGTLRAWPWTWGMRSTHRMFRLNVCRGRYTEILTTY